MYMLLSHIVAEVKYISAVTADKLGEINTELLLLNVCVYNIKKWECT